MADDFCCDAWREMGDEAWDWCVEEQIGGATVYRITEANPHSYSDYTSGVDHDAVGPPIRFCPFCGSNRPGRVAHYPARPT